MEAVLYYLKQGRDALDLIVDNRNRRYAHLSPEFMRTEQGAAYRERTSEVIDLQEQVHSLIKAIESRTRAWASRPDTNPAES